MVTPTAPHRTDDTEVYTRTGPDGHLTVFVCDAGRAARRRSVLAQLAEGSRRTRMRRGGRRDDR
ncbi:hypothetical protein [Streptacidiphilus sp. EB129]|uniref:hypothetical protein n=1 Tax=Streptacidiphilus sp. EB129 TaxID=3156262 RepID=UPI003516F20F